MMTTMMMMMMMRICLEVAQASVKNAFSNILESKSSSTRPETKLVSILAKSDGCGVSFLKTLIS